MKPRSLLLSLPLLLLSARVFAQVPKEIPAPTLTDARYYDHTYLSFNGSIDLAILSPPDKFYFAFLAPGTFGQGQLLQMPISSTGVGPGFTFMPGVDVPLGGRYKIIGGAGVKYESVSHSESTQLQSIGSRTSTYSFSIWSIGAKAIIRREIDDRFFAEAGFTATYYLLDYFSGSYMDPEVYFDIEQQKSKYSYDPQRYGLLLGGGFLVPLAEQHMLSVALNLNVPLSQLFYGVTSEGYDRAGVSQVKLWGLALNVSYELPLSHTKRDDSRPTE